MIRSKISRSILVVIFIALVIFLGYLDIKALLNVNSQPVSTKFLKIGYIFVFLCLTAFYVYMKEKLYKMKMKRKHSLILRYIYFSIIIVVAGFFNITKQMSDLKVIYIIGYLAVMLSSAFIIKKVIFNVSKSDILSVIALILYAMLPTVITDKYLYANGILIILFVFATILNLQILIDELKQQGMKTKKYMILSVTLGIFMGIASILGVNLLVWVFIALALLLTTVHLDNTHINFPKKLMHSVTQENREKLYGVERINISKLFIGLCIMILILMSVYYLGSFTVGKLQQMTDHPLVHMIYTNIQNNHITHIFDVNKMTAISLKDTAVSFVNYAKVYYLIVLGYILLVEFLNIILKRKYDTKSTMLKTLLVLLFIALPIFKIDIGIFQSLFTIMFVLIAIVNTSNIYLNREERVKLLVA